MIYFVFPEQPNVIICILFNYLFPLYSSPPLCRWSLWSRLYGSLIYNNLCNQCLLPLKLWVWIPIRRGVLGTTLCDKFCQWLAAGRWFSPSTPVASVNKTDRHNITEILFKVALNIITLTFGILTDTEYEFTTSHMGTNNN